MSNNIYPISPLQTKENLFISSKVKTKAIYVITIVVIITAIVLLPLIKVTLSIQGRGIIRPITEKAEIKAIQPEQSVHFVKEVPGFLVRCCLIALFAVLVTLLDIFLSLQSHVCSSVIHFMQQLIYIFL